MSRHPIVTAFRVQFHHLCSGPSSTPGLGCCGERAAYVVEQYGDDGDPATVVTSNLCVRCTALMRANDPLETISSVRTYRPTVVGDGD